MIPTLRILTRKSKLGFGKWKDYTVQRLLDLGKPIELITPYYKLTSINYIEDILIELKITEDYRVDKPGKDLDEYYRFLNDKGFKKKYGLSGADIMKKRTKKLSKSQLQSKNHGH